MTRSTNMEHVEVLRHMKETIKAIMPSEVAALDAAIAALSAPHPPSAPVGMDGFRDWVIEQMPAGTVIDNPELWAERLIRAYELNVPPPSAPVGVEVASLPALWRQREDNGEERTEFDKGYEQASDECAEALERALGQQPAAVDAPNVWRAAFVAERAARYREGGMAIEQARIHAETDATLMEQAASQQHGGAS